MYWPAQHILFAADVHVGKEHVFARHGIAIPTGISESTLISLFDLARRSGAKKLVVLGDFLHNVPLPSEGWLRTLSDLMDALPSLQVEIVAGNHDRKAGLHIIDKRVIWHASSVVIDGLALHHEPCVDHKGFVLSGHLHPAWRLGSSRRGGIRAPVFWFQERCAVLPAFGEFTGGMLIEPDIRLDALYMVGPDCVVPIPLASMAKSIKRGPRRR